MSSNKGLVDDEVFLTWDEAVLKNMRFLRHYTVVFFNETEMTSGSKTAHTKNNNKAAYTLLADDLISSESQSARNWSDIAICNNVFLN